MQKCNSHRAKIT